jgi:hypothetical protein
MGEARNGYLLEADDRLVQTGDPCPICDEPFSAGDVIELVTLGPDLVDREAVRRARDGMAYNARAVSVHTACRPPGETFDP